VDQEEEGEIMDFEEEEEISEVDQEEEGEIMDFEEEEEDSIWIRKVMVTWGTHSKEGEGDLEGGVTLDLGVEEVDSIWIRVGWKIMATWEIHLEVAEVGQEEGEILEDFEVEEEDSI